MSNFKFITSHDGWVVSPLMTDMRH